MFEGTKSGQFKPPSGEWYEFAERIESESKGDPGAGRTAEEFLPSFWAEESEAETSARPRHSWFWPSIIVGAIAGSLFAAELWRRSRDKGGREDRIQTFGTSDAIGYDERYNPR